MAQPSLVIVSRSPSAVQVMSMRLLGVRDLDEPPEPVVAERHPHVVGGDPHEPPVGPVEVEHVVVAGGLGVDAVGIVVGEDVLFAGLVPVADPVPGLVPQVGLLVAVGVDEGELAGGGVVVDAGGGAVAVGPAGDRPVEVVVQGVGVCCRRD